MSRYEWVHFINISFMKCFTLYLDQNIGLKMMYLPNMVKGWEEKYTWVKNLLE